MTSEQDRPCRVQTAVRRLVAASTRLDHEVGARAGLTMSTCEANFVNLLLEHGQLTPGELGRLAGLSSSGTITGVIDRLERAGYVHRARCTRDRRKVMIELDADHLAAENAARSQRLAAIIDDYDHQERAVIAGFLSRVADAEAGGLTDQPAAGPTI